MDEHAQEITADRRRRPRPAVLDTARAANEQALPHAPVRGRRGRPPLPDLQLRRRTAGTRCPTRPTRSAGSPRSTASTVHLAGSGGQAADTAEAFEGIDTTLILATLGVVIVILLFTYRSPVLWLLPISRRWSRFTSPGPRLLAGEVRRLTVNGQSQAILSILVIGAGTDYALLLVARYREELRSHEDRHEAMAYALHRAAPAILASAATVVHRHALPDVRRPELDRRSGSGGRRRHRGDLPGDGHPAARPAGHLRPLGLLAEAARVRVRRADQHRPVGQGRPDRSPRRGGSGWSRPAPARRLPRPVPARRQRPGDRGHLHQGVRLDQGPEGADRARLADQSNTVLVVANAGRRRSRPRGDGRDRRAR